MNWVTTLGIINALGRNLGPFSDSATTVIAFLGFAILAAGSLRLPWARFDRRDALMGAASVTLGWIALLNASVPALRTALMVPMLTGLHWMLRGTGSRLADLRPLLLMCLFAAIYQGAIDGLPLLAEIEVAIAGAWSGFWGTRVLPQPVLLGPAALGGGILVTGLLAVLAMSKPAHPRFRFAWKQFLWGAIGILASNLIFLRLQNDVRLVSPTARAQFLVLFLQLLLVGVILFGVRAWLARTRPQPRRVEIGRLLWPTRRKVWAMCMVCFAAGIGLVIWPRHTSKEQPAIAFLDAGYVNWERPQYGRYGVYETGLFGSVHDYLAAAGRRTFLVTNLSPAELRDAGILVVINPTNHLTQVQRDAIWSFVAEGGGLWVLGDHTDIMGSKAPLDELLAPVGVRFNFDSGFPARPEWRDCLHWIQHPITRGLGEASDAIISVGASLEVHAPSHTLVWGRYGFSDLGNHLNPQGAYLGDYAYQRGEQLGDVSLVAASYWGKGRVLIFGDTSPLQNVALPQSFETFVTPCLEWLGGRDYSAWIAIRWLLVLAAFAAVLVIGGWLRTPWLLAASLMFAGGLILGRAGAGANLGSTPLKGSVALIDLSHGNRVSLAPLRPDSIGPFLATLMRNGFLPGFLREWSSESLQRASVLVVTAPSARFTRRELSDLDQFVRNGGLLIFNCGWPEKGRAAEQVLDRFGFEVLRLPLGPYPVQRLEDHLPGQAQFINAWSVRIADPALQGEFAAAAAQYRSPLLDTEQANVLGQFLAPLGGTEVSGGNNVTTQGLTNAPPVSILFQTHDGHPVIVSRRWGEGSVVVIGDTYFLGNDNLENLRYYRKGNLLFLKHLFEQTAWRRR